MKLIEKIETKKQLLNADVLKKIKEKRKINFHDIDLISIDNNIILWRVTSRDLNLYNFFYTDINGNLLFNGTLFNYATSFSNSLAFIELGREYYIIDINNMLLVKIPNEIVWDNLNGFRNNNLAVFDKTSHHWGSYYYDEKEQSFKKDIPFIWDALEFSRNKDIVYVGIHEVSPYSDPYKQNRNFDMFQTELFRIKTLEMNKKYVYDLERYKKLINLYKTNIYFDEPIYENSRLRIIEEQFGFGLRQKERKLEIKSFIEAPYELSDYYFDEPYRYEYIDNNVDVGNLNDYKKVLGKKL